MPLDQFNTKAGHPKSSWYQTYFAAVLESDRRKAVLQIERAQIAIQDRLLELRKAPPDNPREVQDLSNALTYLGILFQNIDSENGHMLWD